MDQSTKGGTKRDAVEEAVDAAIDASIPNETEARDEGGLPQARPKNPARREGNEIGTPGTRRTVAPVNARKLSKKAYRKRRKLSAAANSISTGNPGLPLLREEREGCSYDQEGERARALPLSYCRCYRTWGD